MHIAAASAFTPRAALREHVPALVGAFIVVTFLAVCVQMTRHRPESWNDISRVAGIESLVERGTWVIDESPWQELTKDKAFIRGRFYTDKMPLPTAVGAAVYAVQRSLWGTSLSPECQTAGQPCGYYGLTLVMAGLPGALLLALFYSYTLQASKRLWVAALATLALALGTMIWPYSLVLNHHIQSAAALFACFYLLTRQPRPHTLALAGFCAGLAVATDALSLIMAAGLGLVALPVVARDIAGAEPAPFTLKNMASAVGLERLARLGKPLAWFVGGALIPLFITVYLDYQITGTILPPYMIPGAFAFPGSDFADTIAGNVPPDDLYQYAFKMLFGAQGLYAYNPILFLALAGLVIAARRLLPPYNIQAVGIGLSFAALTLYLTTQTGDLGGVAYGERWYVHALPLVFAFIVFAPPFARTPDQKGLLLAALVLVVLFSWSAVSSYQGAMRPWRYAMPPGHPTRNPQTGEIGFRWNLRLPFR